MRGLARVLGGAVALLEEPEQFAPEDVVIVRAAETRLGLEFGVRDPAFGAADLVHLGSLRGLHEPAEQIADREVELQMDAGLTGALVAEVRLFLHPLLDSGEMNRRVILMAFLAVHRLTIF